MKVIQNPDKEIANAIRERLIITGNMCSFIPQVLEKLTIIKRR